MQLYPQPIHIALVQEYPREDFIIAESSQRPRPQIEVGTGAREVPGVPEVQWRLQHQVQVLIVQIVLWCYHLQHLQPAVIVQMLIMVQPLPLY